MEHGSEEKEIFAKYFTTTEKSQISLSGKGSYVCILLISGMFRIDTESTPLGSRGFFYGGLQASSTENILLNSQRARDKF